jgi:nicotinate-nucleotide pyrophosphorylase (carboxylating)
MKFSDAEAAACRRLVDMAWEEDLGPKQDPFLEQPADITSQTLIPPDREGRAVFVARAAGVVAGLPALQLVFDTVHTPLVKVKPLVKDGDRVEPGQELASVSGLLEFILSGERIALNFLQHLSGVATLTRRFADAVAGLNCKILDTRKTLPGWRVLEKYAVRCGGGHNHRMGLYDAILIKDNHLAILGVARDAFKEASRALLLRSDVRPVPVEIEVDSLEQLDWAMDCRPGTILLDNMSPEQLRRAVQRRSELMKTPRVLLEASGGVTLETVRAIAETGVDRISVGALTHSAPALDVALDYAS